MVELNHLEVQIFRRADPDEDLGVFEAGGGQICTFTKTRIIPFPEYPITPASPAAAPIWPTINSYVEVTPRASFRVDLQIKDGFKFAGCDVISYNIKIDNGKTRCVYAWESNYTNPDDPVGRDAWASYLPGNFKFKTRKSKSVQKGRVSTIEVEVRPWVFESPRYAFENPYEKNTGKNIGGHRFAKFVFKCVTADFLRFKNITLLARAVSQEQYADESDEETEASTIDSNQTSLPNSPRIASNKKLPPDTVPSNPSSSKRPRSTRSETSRREVVRPTGPVRTRRVRQVSDDESIEDGDANAHHEAAIRMARAGKRPIRGTRADSVRVGSKHPRQGPDKPGNDESGIYDAQADGYDSTGIDGVQDDDESGLQQTRELQRQQPYTDADTAPNNDPSVTPDLNQSNEQRPPRPPPRANMGSRTQRESNAAEVADNEEKPKPQLSFTEKQRGFVREHLSKLPSHLTSNDAFPNQIQERRQRVKDIATVFQHLCEDHDDGFIAENDERDLIEEILDELEAEMEAERDQPDSARIRDDRAAKRVRALRRRLHHLIRNTVPA